LYKEAQYFPPIELSPQKNYVLGLIELLTFNSIPNVDVNNKFHVGGYEVVVPIGSYEIKEIAECIRNKLTDSDITLDIKPNNNTLRSEIKSNRDIDFTLIDSIGRTLGFNRRILEANKVHISDLPVTIIKVNALRVECNITAGAYINSSKAHTIHEFFPTVAPGYKIVEVPNHVIYLPVTVRLINHIQLRIVDQDGELVNFRGETITIRLHLKST
jgi:hypothetical protein